MKQRDEIFSKIRSNNLRREKITLSRYACKNSEGVRKFPDREKVPDWENIRPIFSHDADKIMHSKAYSRYIDKTQVFYLFENDHITHRVLHVQLVSKVGRVIGRCLRLNEDLIEAISLGHDLGHVPYGHDGERMLNKLCTDTCNELGCFCHNAQSARLLMEVEQKGKGLNLSLQVLDGILAHNGEILSNVYKPEYSKTFEKFEDEYRKCFEEESYSKEICPMTLEGCVVRISDVIAYIGRDIEDAITVNLIKRSMIPIEIRKTLGSSNDKIINTLVLDLVTNSYGRDYLAFSDKIFHALEELKKFSYEHIYTNPKTNTEIHKIENMYEQLFAKYHQALQDHSQDSQIQVFLRDMDDNYLKSTDPKRMIIDCIAGMTDDFFNNQYEKHFIPQSYGYSVR